MSQFRYPYSIIAGASPGVVYAADTDNHRIVKIHNSNVSVVVGSLAKGQGDSGYKDGTAFQARFLRPTHLLLAPDGNSLIVVDHGNHVIRRVNQLTVEEKTSVETLAGIPGKAGFRDGDAATAEFNNPYSCSWDGNGNLLICDLANHRVRSYSFGTKKVTTLLGAMKGQLNCPVSAHSILSCNIKSPSSHTNGNTSNAQLNMLNRFETTLFTEQKEQKSVSSTDNVGDKKIGNNKRDEKKR